MQFFSFSLCLGCRLNHCDALVNSQSDAFDCTSLCLWRIGRWLLVFELPVLGGMHVVCRCLFIQFVPPCLFWSVGNQTQTVLFAANGGVLFLLTNPLRVLLCCFDRIWTLVFCYSSSYIFNISFLVVLSERHFWSFIFRTDILQLVIIRQQ